MSASIPQFRLNYARDELLNNGLANDPDQLLGRTTAEVAHALFAPAHEQKRFSYGCLIVRKWSVFADALEHEYDAAFIPCSEFMRPFADGRGAFMVLADDVAGLWLPKNLSTADQAALYSMRDFALFRRQEAPHRGPHVAPAAPDFVIVQRGDAADLSVLHWNGITAYRNGTWSFREYQYHWSVEERMAEADARDAQAPIDAEFQQTIRMVLRMGLHVLSPYGRGATILVVRDGDTKVDSLLSRRNQLAAMPELNIRKVRHQSILAHSLAQSDGAALVDSRGNVRGVGLWLTPTDASLRSIKSKGGTRQLTAQAASLECHCLIMTVSADGPVRVYYRGSLLMDSVAKDADRDLRAQSVE